LAVKWGFIFKLFRPFKILSFILFVLFSFIFFYGLFLEQGFSNFFAGLSLISFIVFVGSAIKETFFNSKIKKPKVGIALSEVVKNPERFNLANFLSFESARAINKALRYNSHHSTILFYFLLEDNPELNFIFSRALLDFKKIKSNLKKYLSEKSDSSENEEKYSEEFEDTILKALETAQRKKHERIEVGDILMGLACFDPVFKNILVSFDLEPKDIYNLSSWLEGIKERRRKRRRFWDYENLAQKGTLAKTWSAGYTVNLDQYAVDLTEVVRKKRLEIVGHQTEIELMERILSRQEINNTLLIGRPGTGKKSIVFALAKKSLLGGSLPEVNYKRVMELNMSSLLARVQGIDEAEEVLDAVFKEVSSAGNIILVIDKFHNYVGQDQKPGIIDISGVIAPYLGLPQFQLIAISTYEGLHSNIERNPSILSLFEKVEVTEISSEETLTLLESLAFSLERKYKKMVSYPALREIISLAERYMPSSAFPEKAMDILDEIVIYVASSTKDKVVLPKHVAKVVTEKTEIPVGEIENKEKEVLLNMEELIHQRIINQKEAVKEISTAMRRARSEITVRKGPMGAFLFLGPTGVGKTETSKALAQVYFGQEDKMIRIDMSEFQSLEDIDRLIGSRGEKGFLTTQIRENPFSLLLLDEIEKAHPSILNLFLQVLDEGHLTDGLGRKVDFKNTIIIATSNAGYKVILRVLEELSSRSPLPSKEGPVGRTPEVWSTVKKRLLDYLFANKIFRPEFINRFDAFVVFKSLSKENLLDISALMLNKLKGNLKEKGIDLITTESLKEKIVELGYNPVFGAREMRRVIQEKVENVLAEALLGGNIKRGDRVEMDSEFKLIIR